MLKPAREPRRHAKRLLTVAAAGVMVAPLLAATGVAGAAATTGAAASAVDNPDNRTLRPARIDRGRKTRLLHTEGTVIVDGDRRIRVDADPHLWPLGRSGRAYVVATADENNERWRVLRVQRDGDTRVVARGGRFTPDPVLSDDGSHVALVRIGDKRTRVRVVDTRSGDVLRTRRFRGYLDLEDFGDRRMILSEWSSRRPRTFWWNPHNNKQTRITDQPAYIADISSDRLGLMVSEVPESCQRVTRISDPATTVWRSCEERVFEFAPNGRRMVTGHILSDGPGPNKVHVRRGHGRLLATYRSQWFGFISWENNRSLLMETAGKTYTAAVRCAPPVRCERGSKVFKNPGRNPFFPRAMNWALPS